MAPAPNLLVSLQIPLGPVKLVTQPLDPRNIYSLSLRTRVDHCLIPSRVLQSHDSTLSASSSYAVIHVVKYDGQELLGLYTSQCT